MSAMEAVIVVSVEVEGLNDAADRRTAVGDAVQGAMLACQEALESHMAARLAERGGSLGDVTVELDSVQMAKR